jgi:hypothetical protein
MVEDEDAVRFHVSPIAGEPSSAMPTCATSDTPWCEKAPPPVAFVENSGGLRTARLFALDAFLGQQIRFVFEIAFDTNNCPEPDGHGGRNPHPWKVFKVVVAYDDPP